MKVPTYQTQVSYRAATARPVALAAPTRESSRSKGWSDLSTVAEATLGALQVQESLEKIFSKDEDKNKKKSSGPEANFSKKQHTSQEILSPMVEFSSPQRQALLQFSRQEAFASAPAGSKQESAVAKLDDYFGKQARGLALSAEHADDLLVQDYTVLRREVAAVEEQQANALKQEQFAAGVNHFVQTAGMISTPQALEQYIESNLTAAKQEALQNGISEETWYEQQQMLRTQALQHNIESALGAGQLRAAQEVCTHFAKQLPADTYALLQEKLAAAHAGQLAEKYGALAKEQCLLPTGEISSDKLSVLAKQIAQEQEVDANQLTAAFQTELAGQIKKDFARQASFYSRLLQSQESAQDIWPELMNAQLSSADFIQAQQVYQQWKSQPQAQSAAAVFNALYEEIARGSDVREELQHSLARQELSARDWIYLQQHFCQHKSTQADSREAILQMSVDKICRDAGLNTPQQEQAKYFVQAAGVDFQTRLQAAKELKNLLTLQEKKQ